MGDYVDKQGKHSQRREKTHVRGGKKSNENATKDGHDKTSLEKYCSLVIKYRHTESGGKDWERLREVGGERTQQ